MQSTNSFRKLSAEVNDDNARLKEPLLLFAVCSQKQDFLLDITKGTRFYSDCYRVVSQYDEQTLLHLLETGSEALPAEYHKVWRTFLSKKNKAKAEDHTKELIRQKVQRLQSKSGVTNYRIYTDLQLNPGNVNAWLKNGDCSKVSLDAARKVLRYVESQLIQAN